MGMIFAILLFPVSFAQGFEWNSLLIWEESQFISVAIISDFDIDDKTVKIIKEDIEESSITIELSKFEGPKNMDGFTQYEIIDKKINKATVIIYDYDMLKQEQLELVVRHELGHALGLGHTYNSLDLMFPALDSKYSLISMFDLETLSEIYMKT